MKEIVEQDLEAYLVCVVSMVFLVQHNKEILLLCFHL
jgi:hypothetical protein